MSITKILGDDLQRLRIATTGCREDMHEPDEQNVYAEFGPNVIVLSFGKTTGYIKPSLDNACTDEPVDGRYSDMGFWLIKREYYLDGSYNEKCEWFNLANIIALARR